MQDHGCAKLAAQVLLTKLEERLADGAEQQREQETFVGQDEGIEGVGHGTHRMEVGCGEQLRALSFDPLGRGPRLTFRTMAIPA
jgi:hypothetical protein